MQCEFAVHKPFKNSFRLKFIVNYPLVKQTRHYEGFHFAPNKSSGAKHRRFYLGFYALSKPFIAINSCNFNNSFKL
jgi:hypothetical protein